MTDVRNISAREWSMRAGAPGEVVTDVDDVAQCIALILNTPVGSQPLRPLFGSKWHEWIDRPVTVAGPAITADIIQAIGLWEPRAKITSITHSIDGSTVAFDIRWETADGQAGESEIT